MNKPFSQNRRGRFFILFLVILIYSGNASVVQGIPTFSSQEVETSQVEPELEDLGQPNLGPMVVKTIGLLLLLIVMAYLGMYIFKHFSYRKRGEGLSIRVVGSTLLGPKKGIYLVEIEDRRLVLGVTEASISFLTELEQRSPDELPPSLDQKSDKNTSGRFQSFLDTLTKK